MCSGVKPNPQNVEPKFVRFLFPRPDTALISPVILPSSGSNPDSAQYSDLLESVYRISKMRHAVILDDFGDRIAGGMKPGVESYSPPGVERKLETQSTLMLRMAEDYSKYVGSFAYISMAWEKMTAAFFFLPKGYSLSVSLDGMDVARELEEILEIVKARAAGSTTKKI